MLDDIPNVYKPVLRIEYQGIDLRFSSDAIYGKRLTIAYDTADGNGKQKPHVYLDGVQQDTNQGKSQYSGYDTTLKLSAVHTAYGSSEADQGYTQKIKVGGTYTVVNGWGPVSRSMMQTYQAKTAEDQAACSCTNNEAVLGGILAQLGATYLSQVSQSEHILSQIAQTSIVNHHLLGVAGQTPANMTYVDYPGVYVSAINWVNATEKADGAYFALTLHASALESTSVKQITGVGAVSTVSLFDREAQVVGNTFYDATSANYNSTIKAQLDKYSRQDLDKTFPKLLSATNAHLILPKNGSISDGGWKGSAYFSFNYDLSGSNLDSMGAIISGNLYGGASFNVTDSGSMYDFSSGLFNDETKASSYIDSRLTLDPVDNFTGAFVYSHDDLVVGQGGFPYALAFQTHYSSAARNTLGPLGNGTTHNFIFKAKTGSDAYQGLGEDSALDAAAALVEMYIAVELLDTAQGLHQVLVATLGTQWVSEQLIDNTVAVTRGSTGEYFVKLADGTYNPPPKSAVTLTFDSQTSQFKYEAADKTVIDFNSDNNATQWRNAAGMVVNFGYTSGKLASVSNNLNRTLTINYTGDLIDNVTDGSRTVYYDYDGSNNLTSFTDAAGKVTTFSYLDPAPGGTTHNGVIYKIFTPNYPGPTGPASVTNTYDSLWRVKSQLDGMGNKSNLYLAGTRSEVQQVDKFNSDNDNPLNTAAVIQKNITYYTWWGDPAMEIDGAGNTVSYEYDGLHRLTKKTLPEGDSLVFTYPTTNSISNLNNVIKQEHHSKTSQFVAPTAVSKSYAYDATWNKVNQITDERGNVTTGVFDTTTGNLKSITYPDPGDGNGAPTVSYTYNNVGQVVTKTDPSGVTSEAIYNSDGEVTDFFEVAGEWSSHTDYTTYGDPQLIAEIGDTSVATNITYDNLRRKLSETLPDPDDNGPLTSPVTKYNYDDNGNLIKVGKEVVSGGCSSTLPEPAANVNCQVTKTIYTASDKPDQIIDSMGRITKYTYDRIGRVDTVTEAYGTADARTTRTTYDTAGRVATVTKAYGTAAARTETHTYTPNGKLERLTDSRNNTTQYVYDELDRLQDVIYPDGSTETYSDYDEAGNVGTLTTRSGSTIGFTYDALNRKLTKSPQGQATVEYGYDKNSRLTSAKYTGSLGAGDAGAANDTWSQTYDVRGQLKTSAWPDGKTVTYGYDQYKNRTSIVYPDSTNLVYGFDQLKRLTNIVTLSATPQRFAQWSYDNLSRVSGRTVGVNATYSYVLNSNLLQTIDNSVVGTLDYGYNNMNQITSRSVSDDSFMWHPTASVNSSYGTANAVNQYAKVDDKTFFYDGNGNLHNDGQYTYTYDTENRLVSAVGNGTTATYTYDPLGRRFSKTVNGTTTRYFNDGTNEIVEYSGTSGSTVLRKHVFAGSSFVATVENSVTTQAHKDIQGSIIAMRSGASTTSYTYSPYGLSGTTQPALFGYTGQRFDPETGLYYYKARYYNPKLGRFLQTDPIGYKDNLNMYAYVNNDPINMRDPTGLGGIGNQEFEISFGGSTSVGVDSNYSKSLTKNNNGGSVTGIASSTINGSTNDNVTVNLQMGFGGAGTFIVTHGNADSGFAADTSGTFCGYTSKCVGGILGNPVGATLGIVGGVGTGELRSGVVESTAFFWAGGKGIGGEGVVSKSDDGNISIGRALFGIKDVTPGNPIQGAGVLHCTTNYFCMNE